MQYIEIKNALLGVATAFGCAFIVVAILLHGALAEDVIGPQGVGRPTEGSGVSVIQAGVGHDRLRVTNPEKTGDVSLHAISTDQPNAPSGGEQGPLHGWSLFVTLLSVFLGGLALNLTPCVYPLVPVTVSFFGGRTGEGRGKLALNGLLYVLGLSFTNSILGVTAALTGGLMGAALQQPIVLVLVAAVMVLFATSLFGLWELRLPQRLTNAASGSYTGYFGSLFMGLTLGIVAAPCMGPFVIGLLTWVAGLGSVWLGFLIFFTLSLGLGLPLFFLALFAGSLDKLPNAGEWMLWVRKLMGWLLIGMAAYFVAPVVTPTIGTLLLAGTALAAGLHLGWLDRTRARFNFFPLIKTATGVVGVAVAAFLIGSWLSTAPVMTWHPYSEELMELAAKSRKPVIVEFSADWCLICRELNDITFSNWQVVKESQNGFVMLRVDVTNEPTSQQKQLIQKHQIRGVPTVLFFDAEGRERQDLRLVGFVPPKNFLSRMDQLKNGTGTGA